jgi:protein TonB
VEELPEPITKVAPEYPEKARKANVEGIVEARALVGKDGLVKDVKILSSPSPLLDAAAVTAVRKWVFRPAMAFGKPVAVWVSIPVTFRLQ